MIRELCIFSLALVAAAIPLRAANGPHAGADNRITKVWTNDDLEKLHHALHRRGITSSVGALSAALTSSAVATPPSGLAAVISTAALSGAAATTAGAGTADGGAFARR